MASKATSVLDELLAAWDYTRRGFIAELQNLPDTSLDFKPTPAMRSGREIAQHVVESGLLMSGELSRPDGDFLRKPYPALMKEHSAGLSRRLTKASLVATLRRTHADGARRIRSAGEVGMLQTIRQFNGARATRLSWMHHGIAHEEYHRGQLALYARLVGRVPALTKLIEGA
jgi:uncharacterized damage-inducible protein DinB